MPLRAHVPIYTLTLILSAALLFSVQPLFSKMILPLLGGSPHVWNTAMMFFQLTLLAGYAYAHTSSRFLNMRTQAILHIALLCLFALVLPVAVPADTLPPLDQDPTLWQITLMLAHVGGPFFVLSGSAPMLQRWFSITDHPDAHNPYFLYGASNLGSMSALFLYPVLIEPFMTLTQQSGTWSSGYITLILCTLISAALVWRNATQQNRATNNTLSTETKEAAPTWRRRLHWITLALVPSSLMLGVTTYITTDIASMPLLWIVPLALYVSTFILVFARKQLMAYNNIMFSFGMLAGLFIICVVTMNHKLIILIPLHLLLFFFAAYACHTDLAKTRPAPQHLTEFYLLMSLGGALGGVFNALIAPMIFTSSVEYPIMLVAAIALRYSAQKQDKPKIHIYLYTSIIASIILAGLFFVDIKNIKIALIFIAFMGTMLVIDKRWLFFIPVGIGLALYTPGGIKTLTSYGTTLHQERNFFGVLKVVDDTERNIRFLLHGTTNHGAQALETAHKLTPISYYSPQSPLRDIVKYYDTQKTPQNFAVLGLGIGVVACFKKDQRHYDFFEIDPDVAKIAEDTRYFTFLSDCGSDYEIILGDGRLTMKERTDHAYDFILLDAFSSDNIPAHLLTIEAIKLYLSKLKTGGTILFNVSNNFLDIEPVLMQAAKQLDITAYARFGLGGTLEDSDLSYYPAHYVALSNNADLITSLKNNGWSPAKPRKHVRAWSDQYSNIISVIQNKTGKERFIQATENKKEAISTTKMP